MSAANLENANLERSNLAGADLKEACLSEANLTMANLRMADLSWADLKCATLIEVDLLDADLSNACLSWADLTRAKNFPEAEIVQRTIVPPLGTEFVAWKKLNNGTIAELKIPADAGRVGGITERKCRASKVIVVTGGGESAYQKGFYYAAGLTVEAEDWDADPLVTCAGGIHFFLTKEEAEKYCH